MVQEQVEKIIHECQVAAGKPYRDPAPSKPDGDGDGNGGATGQPGMTYEVTVKYIG